MKLIIDISDKEYKQRIEFPLCYNSTIDKAITNGIPLPDNATNGEVIKTLFPNAEIKESHKDMYGIPHLYIVYKLDIYPTSFTSDFWNTPYKLSELKGE